MNNLAEDISWQIDESIKVCDSFEYFCDEFVWIEDKQTKAAIKLKLWPEQRKVLGSFFVRLLILLKTRQVGLTWLSAAYVLWLGITNPLFLSIIISASEDHSVEFLDRVKFILDRLPDWLIPPIKSKTQQVIEFVHKGGTISTIKSLPTTNMGAESKTPNVLIIDEAHTIRNVHQIYNSSYPGIEQAKGQVIIIANSIKSGSGWGFVRDLYTASMKGLNKFVRIFLSWTAHPDRPADFRQRMVSEGMSPEDVKENYPESEAEALEAATGSYFGDVLKRHNQTAPGIKGRLVVTKLREIEFVEDKRGPVELWRYPYHLVSNWDGTFYTSRYAVGSDVSEGLGNTYSVAYVYDRLRDEHAAKIRSNRIDAVDWAHQVYLLQLYYGNHSDRSEGERFRVEKTTALACVEVTGSGQTTVKELIKKRANQYVRVVPDVTGSGLTKQYGWPETQSAKYELANDLKQWLKTMNGRLYDALLIDQCATFIRHDNGKIGHEEGEGKFDDDVIAAGLAIQASNFMGEGPKKIIPPVTGWQARELNRTKKGTIWAK